MIGLAGLAFGVLAGLFGWAFATERRQGYGASRAVVAMAGALWLCCALAAGACFGRLAWSGICGG